MQQFIYRLLEHVNYTFIILDIHRGIKQFEEKFISFLTLAVASPHIYWMKIQINSTIESSCALSSQQKFDQR